MKKGKLIIFETINGGGKEEQMSRLQRYIYKLARANTIFLTREPNEFDANGKMARQMLASDGNPYENGLVAVEYFAKNRQTHNKIFDSMLDKGIDVLCDRYYYSNLAYQHAQGISYEEIAKANQNTRRPDLTYIFNVTPEEAVRRKNRSQDIRGRKFDSDIKFNKRVLDNYLELGKILPDLMQDNSIVYINGMQSIEDVWVDVKKVYDETLL